MMRFRDVCISMVALGAMAMPVLADGPVTVVGKAKPGLTVPVQREKSAYELIPVSNMNRDTVGLLMRDDVVEPEVATLQMGGQAIYVDPDRNYIKQTGGIDSGHSIMRAQRLYKALTAQNTAYVIHRGKLAPVEEKKTITPRAILLRPDFMQRRTPQQPMTPAPAPMRPKVEKGPVASAM